MRKKEAKVLELKNQFRQIITKLEYTQNRINKDNLPFFVLFQINLNQFQKALNETASQLGKVDGIHDYQQQLIRDILEEVVRLAPRGYKAYPENGAIYKKAFFLDAYTQHVLTISFDKNGQIFLIHEPNAKKEILDLLEQDIKKRNLKISETHSRKG